MLFRSRAAKGSNIDVKSTLLIFVNDILQKPGEAYFFEGGSVVEFSEAPKAGDFVKVIFYKGSGDIDVVFRDVLETIKVGDELTLNTNQDLVKVLDFSKKKESLLVLTQPIHSKQILILVLESPLMILY